MEKETSKNYFIGIAFFAFLFFISSKIDAIVGGIDPAFKYAWSEIGGWINFGCKKCNIQITDSAITGYAWSEYLGWINLSPQNGGVKNQPNGKLSGYAFGDGFGWIDFSNVRIDENGEFRGFAVDQYGNKISFECDHCKVKTTWKPSIEEEEEKKEIEEKGITVEEKQVSIEKKKPEGGEYTLEASRFLFPPPISYLLPLHIKFSQNINTAAKVLSTIGLISFGLSLIFAYPLGGPELLLLPYRIFALLISPFILGKKRIFWGTVYDSVTKQPLDPAYIELKTIDGKDVASAITDIDGRYGFLVKPGIYKINVTKTNYLFPSKKLMGKIRDEVFENLYFGEPIEIKKEGEAILKNIPMDPLAFDWNEFVKRKKGFLKFFSRTDIFLRRISDVIFFIGFFVAFLAFLFAPYPYNVIIFCSYLIVILLRIIGIRPNPLGYVIEKETGLPLSFSILEILDPHSGYKIATKVADRYGRYYCLVAKGEYVVRILKKNEDGSYSVVFTSKPISAKRGIIKEKFLV